MDAHHETPGERVARLHSTLVTQVMDLWELESDVIRHYQGSPELGRAIWARLTDPRQMERWRVIKPSGQYPPAILEARRAMLGTRPADTPAARAYLAPNPARHIAEVFLAGGDTLTRHDLQSLEDMHGLYTDITDASDVGKGLVATLGATAVIAKLVPKEVFAYFHLTEASYELYQVVVTALAVLCVVGIAVYWVYGGTTDKRRRASEGFHEVLLYLKIGTPEEPARKESNS